MEAVLRAAWALRQGGPNVPAADVLGGAAALGLPADLARLALENWVALGVWRLREGQVRIEPEALGVGLEGVL
eukprot:9766307-Lingulodinium_polyedra.AAC.1